MWEHLRVHSLGDLPWLTFLRFFDVFAGASEPVAVGLVFEGELFLEALVSCVDLGSSASLCSVMATGEAPFDRFAASGIQGARWAGLRAGLRAGCFFLLLELRSLCTTAGIWPHSGGPEATEKGQKARWMVAQQSLGSRVNEWRRCGFCGRAGQVNVCGREGLPDRRDSTTPTAGNWPRQPF